jgi:hypothetical protein
VFQTFSPLSFVRNLLLDLGPLHAADSCDPVAAIAEWGRSRPHLDGADLDMLVNLL